MSEEDNLDEAPEQDGDAAAPEADPVIADFESEPEAEAELEAASAGPEEAPAPSSGKNSAFMGVPIEVIISVGKARPLVSDLVNLRRDSVISLDSKIDDPVEIFIGDRLIARGELQEMEGEEGQLGVRLTEVADLSNGV